MSRLAFPVLIGMFGFLAILPAPGVRANHAQDAYWNGLYWGNYFTFYDFYPSNNWPNWGAAPYRDHNLLYRVCTSYGNEVGYAIDDWLNDFGFNSLSTLTKTLQSNCGGSSNLLYYLDDNDDEVTLKCGSSLAKACFDPGSPAWDSYVGRWEVTSAVIWVRKSWIQTQSQNLQISVFEHEFGHGMGMKHHPACTNYVMESAPCNGWWQTAADITTARCVYGYAC